MARIRLPLAFLALTTATAHAELLQAVRPGVMCTSPAALARLSKPDGSSRLDPNMPSPATAAIARAGGCTDFPAGNVVSLTGARHNTSIVQSDTLTGDGVLGTFIVANIDYRPYVQPHDPALDAVRTMCPARYETFAIFGLPASDFLQSLPKATRDQIDKVVDDRCSGAMACTQAAIEDEITRRHLGRQRVAFACQHR